MSGHGYRERRLHLQNKEGKKLTVTLRESRPGDEAGMIDCIRDEYADTYFNRNFYEPKEIRKEAESGHILFLVAEAESGEIAGMLILKQFYPEETMCEIASQIFKKKYRGYGLAALFFAYALEILKSGDYSAAYCLPVLFHDITQKLLYRQGLRATGFVLNVFDMDKITHSYKRDRSRKHAQGIQIMALKKQDAGILYLPQEVKTCCKAIYDSLGVAYRIAECGKNPNVPPQMTTVLVTKQDAIQSSLEIHIHRVGADLGKQMEVIQNLYPLTGRQTANIFLNINDRSAVWAYQTLTEQGWFFTGLKPLCSDREYMVLHNAGEMENCMGDYVLTEEFQEIYQYLKK